MTAYIFGNNHQHQKVPMTSPVLVEHKTNAWTMSFILPKDFSLDRAPEPDDQRIQLTVERPKKWAVLRYTGTPSDAIMMEETDELRSFFDRKKFLSDEY